MDNKINKIDWPVMEVGRRKEGPMLILFRVRQHNEKTRQSAFERAQSI